MAAAGGGTGAAGIGLPGPGRNTGALGRAPAGGALWPGGLGAEMGRVTRGRRGGVLRAGAGVAAGVGGSNRTGGLGVGAAGGATCWVGTAGGAACATGAGAGSAGLGAAGTAATNVGSAGAATGSGAGALICGVVSRGAGRAGASPFGPTSIRFEHTEQRARTPPAGTFAGSTR